MNLVLQASTRANQQAGGYGGVVRRDEHLASTASYPLGDQITEPGGRIQSLGRRCGAEEGLQDEDFRQGRPRKGRRRAGNEARET